VACFDSGVGSMFRPGLCRQHLDPQHPDRPTSEEQRSMLLDLVWLVFRLSRWQRGPVRALAAWSGLGGAGGVQPGCGRMSTWAGAVSFF